VKQRSEGEKLEVRERPDRWAHLSATLKKKKRGRWRWAAPGLVGRKKRGRRGEVGPRELLGRGPEKEKGRGKSGLGVLFFFPFKLLKLYSFPNFSNFNSFKTFQDLNSFPKF
jgi:hypothetical protein